MVVSGLKFRALADLPMGHWWAFGPPRDAKRAALLQKYSLAAEQGLDHLEAIQLVCEMRHLGVRLNRLRFVLGEESYRLCLMNITAWPPQPGALGYWLLEIGPATVAKWKCVAAREEDLKLWQAEAADVIDRATEMLRGRMEDVGRGKHDSTTLRRRR